MQPTFSLLLPTRRRPTQLRRLLDSLAETTSQIDALEVILVVDEDDPESLAYSHSVFSPKRIVVPPGFPMGELNARAYDASAGEFVMLLNDDVVARTPGWDNVVLRRLREYPDGIALAHVNDTLMRDHLCTFPIVSRTFCEMAGGVCPRDYRRYRIDDHIEDVFNLLAAVGERRTIYLPDVVFEHDNAVVMPAGHREYHAEADILAIDAPLFLRHFPSRKALALRLLQHIANCRLAAARERLAEIVDPFSLRVPGRQIGSPGPSPPLGFMRRLHRCWRNGGVPGLVRAIRRRTV